MDEIPHAIGPEKSVLSSILKCPEILAENPHLSADHFHLPAHRELYETITSRIDAERDIELTALFQHLHDTGRLDSLGGVANLSEIYTYSPNNAHFKSHARILTEKLALRRAIVLSGEIVAAVAEGLDPQDVAEVAATGSTVLSDTIAESKPASDTKALLRDAAERWQSLALGKTIPMGMVTNLSIINSRFKGLKHGRVTVISALPSQGKSLLGGQLLMDCVMREHNGLFLTWEMSEHELIDRCLAYSVGEPINAVIDPIGFSGGKPTVEQQKTMATAFRKVSQLPLTIRAMHGQNINQAVAMIRREHRKKPLKIVVMDFIQRIGGAKSMERQSYERQLTDIADRFQNLAQELGFHGIVLSQLNKEGGAKHAEGINESCALHLKIVKDFVLGKDGTPIDPLTIKVEGIVVKKDRFHGQTGELLRIKLNSTNQQFYEEVPNHGIDF